MIYLKESVGNDSSPDLPWRVWIQFGGRDSNRFNLSMEFAFEKDRTKDFTSGYWYKKLRQKHSEDEAEKITYQYDDDIKIINDEMKEELGKVGDAIYATLEAAANKYRLKALEVGENYMSKYGDENDD
jgi:hypothetical protein